MEQNNNTNSIELLIAAENGHLETVQHLCKEGINIEYASNTGLTAVMLAAAHGHFDVVQYL